MLGRYDQGAEVQQEGEVILSNVYLYQAFGSVICFLMRQLKTLCIVLSALPCFSELSFIHASAYVVFGDRNKRKYTALCIFLA